MKLRQGILGLAGTLAFLVGMGLTVPAFAADKGAPNFLDQLPTPTKSAYTGCGVGIWGSIFDGDLGTGGPINASSDGNVAGVVGECGAVLGSIYMGVGLDYGRTFGDIKSVGIDATMSAFLKPGVMLTKDTMLYAILGRGRLDTAFGNIDGWQYGGGIQTRLTGAPVFLALEARQSDWDVSDLLGPVAEATSTEVRAVLSYKFGSN